VVADLAYLFVLVEVKKTEVVLEDGRKVRGGMTYAAKVA